jgi:hypothetical protein
VEILGSKFTCACVPLECASLCYILSSFVGREKSAVINDFILDEKTSRRRGLSRGVLCARAYATPNIKSGPLIAGPRGG